MTPDKTIADRVLAVVAAHTGATPEDIRGQGRLDYHVACRHMWMKVLRFGMEWTYPRIKYATGRKCHTNIIHACEAFDTRPDEWQSTYRDVLEVVRGWKVYQCDDEDVRQSLADLSAMRRQLNQADLAAIRQIIDTKKPDLTGRAA